MSGSDAREIERVWVLRAKPMIPHDQETIARVEIWDIEQGYLAPPSANEQSLARSGYPEGRLRRVTDVDHEQGVAAGAGAQVGIIPARVNPDFLGGEPGPG